MKRKCYCVEVYTIKPGDTLYSICKQYSVSVCDLMMANRIQNPYNLRIGTKICIPGEMDPTAGMEPAEPACQGTLYTVERGDTLYMIAKMHGVTLNAIMEANPDIDPYNLRVGMKLCIPR
ncbi:LysM peptidoglycan-binding domain-containing protein [Aminipila luticellarii]|uniref:LysM peptidoglycan-binding domain-containing protein n=1 Tax=Aminipila luticellarii TaxID=2507160 RepID=A0A410PU64_9FIRM|nr:LysM peptidoglycan-binding domain-containing protein [Aminipila luticellarii]QAT42454.1 LysM peptidoglycan-binding domain-containing protein [Aminipila luticellarii]